MSVKPPAWRWYLERAYLHYPPPALPSKQLASAKQELSVANNGSHKEALKLLKTAIRAYHPDRNRSSVVGARWAVTAEEMTKTLTHMYGEYKKLDKRGGGRERPVKL